MIRRFVVCVQQVYRVRGGGVTGGCRDFTDCALFSGKLCEWEECHALALGGIALFLIKRDKGFV